MLCLPHLTPFFMRACRGLHCSSLYFQGLVMPSGILWALNKYVERKLNKQINCYCDSS